MMQDDPLSLVGQVLDETYRIDSMVGEGGFGVVYKAFHLAFEQPIAVKCLKIPGTLSPETRRAFLRKFREEGRLLFQLSQGTLGIVRAFALGDAVTPTGIWTPFVVLEWLEGHSLSVDLHERRRRGLAGRPLGEVMDWLDGPAQSLAHAHQQRVAHRDIKPANLFVMGKASHGQPTIKILDFGIAKVMEEGANAFRRGMTNTGFSSFTPAYAAPEQYDPAIGGTGPWTDVYSFALVALEMLTDRLPVDAQDALGLMSAAMDRNVRPTPRSRGAAVPEPVERVFSRAVAVEPTMRFADIGAFWEALKLVTSQTGPTVLRTGLIPSAALPSVSHPASRTQALPYSQPPAPGGFSNPFPPPQPPPAMVHQPPAYASSPGYMPERYGFASPQPLAQPLHMQEMQQVERPREKDGKWSLVLWVSFGIVVGIALVLIFGGLMCTTCVCVAL